MKPFVSHRADPVLAGVVVLAGLLALGWRLWPAAAASEPSAPVSQARAPSAQQGVSIVPAVERAADGIPIMPAGPSEGSAREPKHPHPHTPIHARIYRENTLFGQLNGAMDVKDVAGMRRLLAEYRNEYPEDAHFLQEGYAIIADCLERPGDASVRSVAQRYWKERRASQLRRYVRRHCLEAAPNPTR